MHTLRTTKTLTCLLLAWFALTLGVAMASPMVAPKAMEILCSDGGVMKLVVVDKNGDVTESGSHTLDCAMCLPASLPTSDTTLQLTQPQPLAHALTPIEQARIAALVGAPLPPRGPPSHA